MAFFGGGGLVTPKPLSRFPKKLGILLKRLVYIYQISFVDICEKCDYRTT